MDSGTGDGPAGQEGEAMIRIFLALTILGAGTGGFLTARQSTIQLQHEAKATLETWVTQTQLVAVAQSDQAKLTEHVRELKQALAQAPAVTENTIWSALQTNRADRLPPELRERLFEELGFNWQSSSDFIVVSKQTVRDIGMKATLKGKLSDMVTTVLAMTPEERGQVEAAMQRVPEDLKDWVLAHVQRSEPKDDVIAHYTLPTDPAMSISNNFAAGLLDALGRERAEILLVSAQEWMVNLLKLGEKPATLIVKRVLVGNEGRLAVQWQELNGTIHSGDLWRASERRFASFPTAFRPIFPNGWADVAQREGFELPSEPQKK
jgi:hypothetical protein